MKTRRALDSQWALRDTHACNPLENAYAHTYQMLVQNGETQASLERRFSRARNVAARARKMKSHTRRVGAYTQRNYLLMLL